MLEAEERVACSLAKHGEASRADRLRISAGSSALGSTSQTPGPRSGRRPKPESKEGLRVSNDSAGPASPGCPFDQFDFLLNEYDNHAPLAPARGPVRRARSSGPHGRPYSYARRTRITTDTDVRCASPRDQDGRGLARGNSKEQVLPGCASSASEGSVVRDQPEGSSGGSSGGVRPARSGSAVKTLPPRNTLSRRDSLMGGQGRGA